MRWDRNTSETGHGSCELLTGPRERGEDEEDQPPAGGQPAPGRRLARPGHRSRRPRTGGCGHRPHRRRRGRTRPGPAGPGPDHRRGAAHPRAERRRRLAEPNLEVRAAVARFARIQVPPEDRPSARRSPAAHRRQRGPRPDIRPRTPGRRSPQSSRVPWPRACDHGPGTAAPMNDAANPPSARQNPVTLRARNHR